MRLRTTYVATMAIAAAALILSTNAVVGQETPRTPDGRPDLQGIWNFSTATPFERPADLADKEFLTPAEAAEYVKKAVAGRNKDVRAQSAQTDVESAYNDFWWDQGDTLVGTLRTSLVIEPKNGRVPALTPQGQQRAAASGAAWVGSPDGPENRSLAERCIMGFNAGPPMAPSAYNNNVQIVQTRDQVMLLNEMIHHARVIPIGDRARVPSNVRLWGGDSRARWDGETLVVTTTNFRREGTGQVVLRGTNGETLRLTERFRRTAADTLIYEFTVEDPDTWVAPWTVQLPMKRTDELIYEYACHEGNYGMLNMLRGARAQDYR